MKGFLKGGSTATVGVVCFLAVNAWMGSGSENNPKHTARDAYVTECMEARIGWRRGTNGYYNVTTAKERVRMAELCGLDFDNGEVDSVVQAVRNGELTVRGQIDPRYHPE